MGGERVLILEDEIMLARDIAWLLTGAGYNVVGSVNCGEDAVKAATDFAPDLVIADIAPGSETSSIQAAEQIRSSLDVAIVYLTEHSEHDLIERAKLTQPHGFLCKPIVHQYLLRTLEMALNRHGVEKKLRRTEEKYRLLYEDAPLGYLCLDKTGKFVEVNQAWLEMLGYPKDQVIGKWFGDFLVPALREHFRSCFGRLRDSREARSLELEMVRQDGAYIIVSFDVKMSPDRGGRITHTHAIAHEITEQKRQETGMARVKELWEHSLDAIPDLIAILDDNHRIVQVNKPMAERIGKSRQEIIGKTCYELLHGTAVPVAACPLVHLMTGEEQHTAEIALETIGGTFLVSATPIVDGNGMPCGCIHVARDISERKQMEETLRQSEAKYRTIVDNIEEGYFEVDLEGTLLFFSDSFSRMFGYPRANSVGVKTFRNIDEAFAEEFQTALGSVLATGQPYRISDWEMKRSDGTSIGVEISLFPVQDADGATIGFRGTCRDITQRKIQEELLIQSERLKAVADLSAGVSHNFNNVLQIVLGGAELALSNLERGNFSDIKSNLEQVLQSSQVGAETVKRLQDFAKWRRQERVEAGKVFNLSRTVEQALEMTKPLWKSDPDMRGISVSLAQCLDPNCLIKGLEHELFDVVVNLIKNAVEALPDGGKITIKTFTTQDEKAFLIVSDNGVGIPKRNLAHLFEPFWTSKGYNGTGMGLAAAYGIVRRHGGEITVESDEGVGATVTVRLPGAKEPLPASARVPSSGGLSKLRILVVDDQQPIVDLLRKALSRHGQTVVPALSGPMAVDLFKESPTDVVICDLGMPLMNGWEVGKAIMEWCREKEIPKPRFIILTGWADQASNLKRLEESGVDAVMEKPVEVKRLLDVLMDHNVP